MRLTTPFTALRNATSDMWRMHDFNYQLPKKEFKKPKLYRFWNFLIYGSWIAIGVFLVYLYSAYVFINK